MKFSLIIVSIALFNVGGAFADCCNRGDGCKTHSHFDCLYQVDCDPDLCSAAEDVKMIKA